MTRRAEEHPPRPTPASARWARLARGPWTARDTGKPVPEIEVPGERSADDGGELITCPACEQPTPVGGYSCRSCGFPLVCDLTPVSKESYRARLLPWRHALGLAAMLFWLVSAIVVTPGYDTYNGYTTQVVAQLAPWTPSGITIDGPSMFTERTQLALGLLRERAPDYAYRMRDAVREIRYLAPAYLEGPQGRKVSLEGIGAVAEPADRLVMVMAVSAFPSGTDQLYDRDAFSYAGILVHELRHIELDRAGLGPGGGEEELLCEQAAYDCLRQMGAPPGLLQRYELYFRNPYAGQYQKWYKWSQQFE